MQSSECCGAHAVCEKELDKPVPEIIYYDDEELDVCAGRDPETYTEEEVAAFAYVLETMKPEDIEGWIQSLQLRDVRVPKQIRDLI